MESEASEFPKGLLLYGVEHVHIRHITPLRWWMWDVTAIVFYNKSFSN